MELTESLSGKWAIITFTDSTLCFGFIWDVQKDPDDADEDDKVALYVENGCPTEVFDTEIQSIDIVNRIGSWKGKAVFDYIRGGELDPTRLIIAEIQPDEVTGWHIKGESRMTGFDETLEILATMESEE